MNSWEYTALVIAVITGPIGALTGIGALWIELLRFRAERRQAREDDERRRPRVSLRAELEGPLIVNTLVVTVSNAGETPIESAEVALTERRPDGTVGTTVLDNRSGDTAILGGRPCEFVLPRHHNRTVLTAAHERSTFEVRVSSGGTTIGTLGGPSLDQTLTKLSPV